MGLLVGVKFVAMFPVNAWIKPHITRPPFKREMIVINASGDRFTIIRLHWSKTDDWWGWHADVRDARFQKARIVKNVPAFYLFLPEQRYGSEIDPLSPFAQAMNAIGRWVGNVKNVAVSTTRHGARGILPQAPNVSSGLLVVQELRPDGDENEQPGRTDGSQKDKYSPKKHPQGYSTVGIEESTVSASFEEMVTVSDNILPSRRLVSIVVCAPVSFPPFGISAYT